MWRKSAAEVLVTLSRHGLTTNVVQYIHSKCNNPHWFLTFAILLVRLQLVIYSFDNNNLHNHDDYVDYQERQFLLTYPPYLNYLMTG